jgi:hypothetical protein
LRFRKASQHPDPAMPEHDDDADYCSNGLTARNYRGATTEDRATYRKWMRGIVAFYSTLLLISGIVAIMNYSNTSLIRLTTLAGHPTAASAKAN